MQVTPAWLLTHLIGPPSPGADTVLGSLYASVFTVFALRKFSQRIKDDIGDKSVFECAPVLATRTCLMAQQLDLEILLRSFCLCQTLLLRTPIRYQLSPAADSRAANDCRAVAAPQRRAELWCDCRFLALPEEEQRARTAEMQRKEASAQAVDVGWVDRNDV